MFFTFKLAEKASSPGSPSEPLAMGMKRSLSARACQPCRERKIRCAGSLPCRACQWHHRTAQCRYSDSKERGNAKRSAEGTARRASRLQRDVLQKLFPGIKKEKLDGLSRTQLLSLTGKDGSPDQPVSHLPSAPTTASTEQGPADGSEAADLASLQPMPGQDIVSGRRKIMPHMDIQDDFSALMSSLKQPSSYLGISSVIAVLRVVDRLRPEVHGILLRERGMFTSQGQRPFNYSSPLSPSPGLSDSDVSWQEATASSSAWDEIPLINSFFTNVHPFIPLVDEQDFRQTYLKGHRTDQRWMLLLSAVLAMGKFAGGPTQAADHVPYYGRVMKYLTIEILDVAHPEVIQSLALLGGFYFHYLQLPNLAHSLMGATLRLATALCLHREYPRGMLSGDTKDLNKLLESRRRVWWCLYILEAWSGTSLGRPSAGHTGRAVTTKHPTEAIGISNDTLYLLQDNIQFCIISTRMEESLAVSPLIVADERADLDAAFLAWYESSGVHEKATEMRDDIPQGVCSARKVTRWRYKWARILLHRPVLLWYAISKLPFEELPGDKKVSIQLCRSLTKDLIQDISTTWKGRSPNIMSSWGATWHLYQATMVPLLTLFLDTEDSQVFEESISQVELSKIALSDMKDHMACAGPSLETVSLLYEASKRRSRGNTANDSQIESGLGNSDTSGPSLKPIRDDSGWTNRAFDAFGQDSATDGLFDTLDWNQYFSYGHTDNSKTGFEWESYDEKVTGSSRSQD